MSIMKKHRPAITSQNIYHMLEHDWKFPSYHSRGSELASLGFSELEIKLIMNSIEWKYQIKIEAESIPLKTTLKEFVQQVVDQSKAITVI